MKKTRIVFTWLLIVSFTAMLFQPLCTEAASNKVLKSLSLSDTRLPLYGYSSYDVKATVKAVKTTTKSNLKVTVKSSNNNIATVKVVSSPKKKGKKGVSVIRISTKKPGKATITVTTKAKNKKGKKIVKKITVFVDKRQHIINSSVGLDKQITVTEHFINGRDQQYVMTIKNNSSRNIHIDGGIVLMNPTDYGGGGMSIDSVIEPGKTGFYIFTDIYCTYTEYELCVEYADSSYWDMGDWTARANITSWGAEIIATSASGRYLRNQMIANVLFYKSGKVVHAEDWVYLDEDSSYFMTGRAYCYDAFDSVQVCLKYCD